MTTIDEMKSFFSKRMGLHISLIQKYLDRLQKHSDELGLDKTIIQENYNNHDASKYQEPEYTPYLYITWGYKCKAEGVLFEIPKEIQEQMNTATIHHILSNNHHPEYWLPNKENLQNIINTGNRDGIPDEMIDGTHMPLNYIALMCVDWCAISEERKTSPFDWAKKTVNIRWKFTKEQEEFLYRTLNTIWP
ncbi:MAG: hypothetical protein H7A25_11410 [Leptospiraceae bacterium]|nr:hypothetical protein [Leptospiraceae bacterium]MCP5500504.1 hypothetical protein [Leptospiraceae bacterium]